MPETTETVEPTITPTPTATPTATPNYYVEVTVEPSGAPARVGREMSVADYWIILLLFAILFSMWLMYVAYRLKERR